jgi:hypothetical protein
LSASRSVNSYVPYVPFVATADAFLWLYLAFIAR